MTIMMVWFRLLGIQSFFWNYTDKELEISAKLFEKRGGL
jgi:hypothetical protein